MSIRSNEEIIDYLHGNLTEKEVASALKAYNGTDFDIVDRYAYWSFQGYNLTFEISAADLEHAVSILEPMKSNPKISDAGYASLNPNSGVSSDPIENFAANGKTRNPKVVPVWFLWLLIDRGMEQYWAFIIPALLNLIDSSDVEMKISGAQLAALVARGYKHKLEISGLVKVLQDALTLLLSFLPPATAHQEATRINSATQAAMLELASTRQDYNYLVIRAFAALEHARGNVEFTISIIHSITNLVAKMEIQAVAHLRQIVNIFNLVVSDPFADISPELLDAAVEMMVTAMQACAPRVPNYRYNILLGVTKGNLWSTKVAKELEKYLEAGEIKEAKQHRAVSQTNAT